MADLPVTVWQHVNVALLLLIGLKVHSDLGQWAEQAVMQRLLPQCLNRRHRVTSSIWTRLCTVPLMMSHANEDVHSHAAHRHALSF